MAWYNTSYLYKKQFTIDHTKVSGGSNLSSFPVCVSRTDTDLKTVGNGGKVQSASGFDIIFVDSTETTKLDHEIEKYVASTGEIEMWVRIPTLSASVDTVIYCYFDNSGISTTQENKTGVWDSNYKRVYHLGDGTTLSVADSTSNAQNGTNNSATATAGQIDGGANFNGSGQNISIPTTGLPTGAGAWTIQCWLSMPSIATAGHYPVAFDFGTHTLHQEMGFYFNGDVDKLSLGFDGGDLNALAAPSANTNYLLHGTYDGTTATFYINGVSQSTATLTLSITYGAAYIGQAVNATLAWVGLIDEARISSTNRSAGWVTTEYNNQSSPSTFYSVGTLTQQAVNKDTSTRFKLAITAWKSVTTRFTLSIQRVRDTATRLKLLASRPRDTTNRFNLSSQQFKALLARLHLSLVRTRDMAARLPLSASRQRDTAARFPLSSGGGLPTAHYVLRAFGGTLLMGFQSIATRLNLIAGGVRDTASRFRLAGQGIKLLSARFALSAQAALTVDYGTPTSVSSLAPGITHVDNQLTYPYGSNDLAAVNRAKALMAAAIPYQNTFIQGWGTDDYWPDPTVAEPGNWGTLDARVQLALDAGAVPVISLCEAPWWMKGALYSGVTYLIPDVNGEWGQYTYTSGITDYRGLVYAAGYQSPDPYGCRVLDNQFANWLHLVQRIAERYMAPPYNVRYFQVWNELKGYWNDVLNTWDYTTGAGDSSGYNAKHGYTYFYNQTYSQLMTTATALGISNAQIKVGGPYNVINTWSSTGFGHASSSLTGKAYGYYDQRDLDVVEYWLQNKTGAGFLTLDANNGNHDSVMITDDFTGAEKFADIHTWVRGHAEASYPGATTLPIWWAEWYASATSDLSNTVHAAAIEGYAMSKLLKAGGAVPLSWGGTGEGTNSTGLWTPTTVGGGQPTPWYTVYKTLHVYFPPGTQLYSVSNPVPASLEVVASRLAALLINKTASPIAVTVNGTALTLAAYAAEVVVQKDAAARFKLSINKLQNTITRFRLASVPLKNTTARFPLSLMRSATIAGRLALLATIVKTVQGRLPLLVLRLRDTSARFPLARVKVQDSHAKLPLAIQAMKNAQGRLPLIVLRIRDVSTRLSLAQLQMKDSRARLPLTISRVIGIAAKFMQIIQKRVDVTGRFPLIVQRVRDTSGRFGLARGTVIGALMTRFLLASGTQVRNIAGRIRLAVQRGRDIAGRLSLIAQKSQNAAARMPLSGLKTLSLASRLKVAGLLQKDIAARFPLQVVGQVVKGLMARFKLLALSSRGIPARFPFSLLRVRTMAARLSLSAVTLRGTAGRFPLGQARVFSTSTRLKVAGQNIRIVVGRFPLGSVRTSDATALLYLALTRYRSVSGRFPIAGQMSKGVGGRFKLATGTSAPTFITVKSARGMITSRGTRGTITVKSSRGTITVKEE